MASRWAGSSQGLQNRSCFSPTLPSHRHRMLCGGTEPHPATSPGTGGCVPPQLCHLRAFLFHFVSHLIINFFSCQEAKWGSLLPSVPSSRLTHLAGPSGPCAGKADYPCVRDQDWDTATALGSAMGGTAVTAPARAPGVPASLAPDQLLHEPGRGPTAAPTAGDPARPACVLHPQGPRPPRPPRVWHLCPSVHPSTQLMVQGHTYTPWCAPIHLSVHPPPIYPSSIHSSSVRPSNVHPSILLSIIHPSVHPSLSLSVFSPAHAPG